MSIAPGTKLGPYVIVDSLGAGALGDMDRAFEHLEGAYQERSGFLGLPGFTPFDGLRSDPRFEQLVRRMGLVC